MLSLQAMGANPTPLPFPEVYSAIQQGVIDGLEGSIMTIYGTKIYEVRKQVSLTNHFIGASAVAISPQVWAKLTPEQQTIIQEEFNAGAKHNNEMTLKLETEYEQMLKDLGVKFNEIDGPAFDSVIADVFTKFPKWTPGIYEKIMLEINKVRNK
jgi:TRAP-type C4-dicarboxylate transport system substrate-binding protein